MHSQQVRVNFSDIQAFRAAGKSWKAIASRLFGEDSDEAADLLGRYFRREMKRQSDPETLAVAEWVESHRKEITRQINAERSWFYIDHVLKCPVPLNTSKGMMLVIGEYQRLIERSSHKANQPTTVQSPKVQVEDSFVPAPATDVNAGQREVAPVQTAGQTKALVTSAQEVKQTQGVNPGVTQFDQEVEQIKQNLERNLEQTRLATGLDISPEEYVAMLDELQENVRKLNMPRLAQGERMSPERYVEFLEFAGRMTKINLSKSPEYDPELSIAELDAEIENLEIASLSIWISLKGHEVSEDNVEKKQMEAYAEKIAQMKEARDYLSMHPNGMFSELSVMSTVGVAYGVFRVCDDDEPGAIELRGLDRPAGEYPNPLYLIEQFTEEEGERICEAHEKDPLERGMSVKRRLYEALCVRGLATHDLSPDEEKYPHLRVHAAGRDFPSPWILPYVIQPFALKKLNSSAALPLVEAEAKRTLR